jgi:hypothetical protein
MEMSDRTKLRRWVLLTSALFPLLALWAISNPMFASPDETVHMVRAQGFSNLDFSTPYRTDGIPIGAVDCFRFESSVTADCMELVWVDGSVEIDARATNGYPPLLHTVAAVPAVGIDGVGGAYAMRLWLAAVVAAGFAWAGVLLTRPGMGPWPLVALVVAITPQVVFISSSVNPSGITAASSALLAAGLISMVTPYRRTPEVIAAVAVGAAGLLLTRRDGGLMLAAMLVAMAPLVLSGILPTIRDRRRAGVRWSSGRLRAVSAVILGLTVAVFVVVSRWGSYASDYLRNPGQRYRSADFAEALGSLPGYLYEIIGLFGWRDTPVGPVFVAIGLGLIGGLLGLAVIRGPRRLAAATVWSVLVLVGVVVASGMIEFTYLQARYLFPVWIAMALTAGVTVDVARLSPQFSVRASASMLVGWAVVQVGAFFVNQRRYSVGIEQVWDLSAESRWDPPMMPNSVAVLLAIGAVVVAVWLLLITAGLARSGGPIPPMSSISAEPSVSSATQSTAVSPPADRVSDTRSMRP